MLFTRLLDTAKRLPSLCAVWCAMAGVALAPERRADNVRGAFAVEPRRLAEERGRPARSSTT